jgi:WD40 repeat protein
VATPKVIQGTYKRATFSSDTLHYAISGTESAVFKVGRKSAVRCAKGREKVKGLAFSKDGLLFAESSSDGRITIGKGKGFATMQTIKTPVITEGGRRPYQIRANDVAFSQDGLKIAVACTDGTRVYDVESGKEEQHLTEEVGFESRECVDWSPDGFIADGSRAGKLRVWDTKTWTLISTFQHCAGVSSVVFDDNGVLYASSYAGEANVFHRDT